MVAFSRSSVSEDADEEAARDVIRRARRLNIAVAVQRRRVTAALAALLGGQGPQGKKRREESTFSWEDHLARLTPKEFKQRYRLDWTAFNELLKLIRADLEPRDEKKARDAKWGVLVPPEVKLAIALRYLAGASHLDLRLIYHVSTSYLYKCVCTERAHVPPCACMTRAHDPPRLSHRRAYTRTCTRARACMTRAHARLAHYSHMDVYARERVCVYVRVMSAGEGAMRMRVCTCMCARACVHVTRKPSGVSSCHQR